MNPGRLIMGHAFNSCATWPLSTEASADKILIILFHFYQDTGGSGAAAVTNAFFRNKYLESEN